MFSSALVEAVDLIDELMSSDGKNLTTCCNNLLWLYNDFWSSVCVIHTCPPLYAGIDYSFNLDENEGVCDLFDVQILNYWWPTGTLMNACTISGTTILLRCFKDFVTIAQLILKQAVVIYRHADFNFFILNWVLTISQHKTLYLNEDTIFMTP